MNSILLVLYVFLALALSFCCSVFEAVVLSVTRPFALRLRDSGKRSGEVLLRFREDIDQPLAAILSLNTIAHTAGATLAGAQAAVVFGEAWVGVFSAVLILLVLVLSEIIPKTIGAVYWRELASPTAYMVEYLVRLLRPFVWLSRNVTKWLSKGKVHGAFSREEFGVMAEIGSQEGHLEAHESRIVRNLLNLDTWRVKDVMTPRVVVFAVPEAMSIAEYLDRFPHKRFSRIPVHDGDLDHPTGFVLRSDILHAAAVEGRTSSPLAELRRELPEIPETLRIGDLLEAFVERQAHIAVAVDEFGGVSGVVTLEDAVETLLGAEIVDEGDKATDMQVLARRLWRQRAAGMGLDVDAVEAGAPET